MMTLLRRIVMTGLTLTQDLDLNTESETTRYYHLFLSTPSKLWWKEIET